MKPMFKHLVAMIVLTFVLIGPASADDSGFNRMIAQAMADLSTVKGSTDLLCLTNAPYVRSNGQPGIDYLKPIQELTGCSVGNQNLLFFQRPQFYPLSITLFRGSTGDAVVMTMKNKVFSTERLELSQSNLSSKVFWKGTGELACKPDFFTIATIAGSWALGAPYDYLKCAELHNHLCPGVSSGYLISKMILDKYSLQQGERYTMISSPIWCKEDAFQVLLDLTPGKRGMIVKKLTQEQKDRISVKNPAGMLLITDKKTGAGKGVVFSFDFDKMRELAPKDSPKAALVFALVDYLDEPQLFVTVAKEFEVSKKMAQEMISAGSNPYEVAGLTTPLN
jgi:formylmethanofuran dehydrogenase subunit E-like metal-binding protein